MLYVEFRYMDALSALLRNNLGLVLSSELPGNFTRKDKANEINARGMKPSKTPLYPNFDSINVSSAGPMIRLALRPMV